MKLEDQVVSLELAKKLKTLGVKQESMFDWIEWKEGKSKLIYNDMEHNYDASIKLSFYSAFTVAELGILLSQKYYLVPVGEADTEADARAKMLIYLLENKLTQPPKA